VVTWLPYPRKDRVTKPRDPVCSRYLAQLFEAFLDPAIGLLTITDTAETIEPPVPGLRRLSVAPMIGRCLARMHSGRAISPTLEATGLSH
jgi:phosphoribosylpyrophosphate synthetase